MLKVRNDNTTDVSIVVFIVNFDLSVFTFNIEEVMLRDRITTVIASHTAHLFSSLTAFSIVPSPLTIK